MREISNGCNRYAAAQRPLVSDNLSIFGYDLPIFVIHCTGLDGYHALSAEGRDPIGFVISHERQSVKAMI